LLAAPVTLHAQMTQNKFERQQEVLREWYERKALGLDGIRANDPEATRGLMAEWPAVYPPWTGHLDEYDSANFGPLLAVSDEGENAEIIARAEYASAKASAAHHADATTLGIMIDGERMVSAGEGPIGPEEYQKLISAAFGRTLASTNVGVRVNTRLYRLFPEFAVADAAVDEEKWLSNIFSAFGPFLKTLDGIPRPLTIRLVVQASDSSATVTRLMSKLEAGRGQGLLSSSSIHRISLVTICDGVIRAGAEAEEIKRVIEIAAQSGVSEIAIDGELVFGARERISLQSLLNILEPGVLGDLFAFARQRKVRLVYRYQVDTDSAARTIWTGLHTARSYGFTAGKYGLAPLDLGTRLFAADQDGAQQRPRGEQKQHYHAGANERRVPPRQLAEALGRARPSRSDRPVVQEALQVVGQLQGRGIALRRLLAQRLQHDRFQLPRDRRIQATWPLRLIVGDLSQQLVAVAALEEGSQRQ